MFLLELLIGHRKMVEAGTRCGGSQVVMGTGMKTSRMVMQGENADINYNILANSVNIIVLQEAGCEHYC